MGFSRLLIFSMSMFIFLRNHFYSMKTITVLAKLLVLVAMINAEDSDWRQSTYLNIHARETQPVFNLILSAFNQAIQQSQGSYADFAVLYLYIGRLKLNQSATDNTYSQPDSYHMTTYYRGNSQYDPSNQAYIEYDGHAGESVVVEVPALLFIPNRILTGVLNTTAFTNNKYKHMTMMLGDMQAFDSNSVLANIFDDGKIYNSIYKNFEASRDRTIKFNYKFLNETNESLAYLIVLRTPIKLITYREATFLP